MSFIFGKAIQSAYAADVVSPFDVNQSSISVSDSSPTESDTITYTVTLKRANGTTITDTTPAPTVTTNNGTLGTVTRNSNGSWSFTHRRTSSGTSTVTVTYDGVNFPNQSITYQAYAFDVNRSSISVSDSSPTESSTVTYTVTVRDTNNDIITTSSPAPTVTTNNGTLGTVTRNSNGTWSFTHRRTSAGTSTVYVKYNNISFPNQSITYQAYAFDVNRSSISKSTSSPTAGDTVTYTVYVRDTNNDLITTSSPKPTVTTNNGTLGSVTRNSDGTWRFTHRRTSSGTSSIYVKYNNISFPTQSITYQANISTGLSPSLWSGSGNKGSNWQYQNVNVSAYMNKNVKIVIWYQAGTYSLSDFQIDNISGAGANYSFDSSPQSWERTGNQNSSYNSGYWVTGWSDSAWGQWNRRSNGTPSGGTGVSSGTFLYYEASGNYNNSSWIRSPQFRITGNTITVKYGAYGANMGQWKFYLDVIS
jgi:hypothetical protein